MLLALLCRQQPLVKTNAIPSSYLLVSRFVQVKCCTAFLDHQGLLVKIPLPKRCRGATRGEFNSPSDAEVRPVANLIRQRKKHHYGLGGSPHERLHQDKENAPLRSWGKPPLAIASRMDG
ncbi:MAG: hypothetical protein F6K50_04050 [Moorea sp. SIO3I7]|uniref:hypothetical protein n=1 Tax=Moorena sp. SIO3I8 TaxID=2607833 RepID=UPI0013BF3989|nr:hypothetical protein [Moorena sp. SIO3I8]NEN94724.1 hypothetical protein [Moorena sp. SIO3I7]NEO07058.1 hypothetical protein [Moorena sp. SIO3I8]